LLRQNEGSRGKLHDQEFTPHFTPIGLLLSVVVHPANIQDRDGAALVFDERTLAMWPFIDLYRRWL
jgi:hypothetical protein